MLNVPFANSGKLILTQKMHLRLGTPLSVELIGITPDKVIQQYSRASIVGSDRVVFRLKGGRYRLIVSVSYVRRIVVFIKFVGTHSEYERINAEEV